MPLNPYYKNKSLLCRALIYIEWLILIYLGFGSNRINTFYTLIDMKEFFPIKMYLIFFMLEFHCARGNYLGPFKLPLMMTCVLQMCVVWTAVLCPRPVSLSLSLNSSTSGREDWAAQWPRWDKTNRYAGGHAGRSRWKRLHCSPILESVVDICYINIASASNHD